MKDRNNSMIQFKLEQNARGWRQSAGKREWKNFGLTSDWMKKVAGVFLANHVA